MLLCHSRLFGCMVLIVVFLYTVILYKYVCYHKTDSVPPYPRFPFTKTELAQFASFMTSWCRQSRAKLDWEQAQSPCLDNMAWGSDKGYWTSNNRTDAKRSFISMWDLHPAGEFSRIGLQTVTVDGRLKHSGGDSWRVTITGRSSVSPTVIDHNNGTYEILFLARFAGLYVVKIVLEYSLCDGYKDPPYNWFIKGNAQGKYQHPSVLRGYERPFLLAPLWGSSPFKVRILSRKRGLPLVTGLARHFGFLNDICHLKCRYLWEGEGEWRDNRWQSYTTGVLERQRKDLDARNGTLWIYGDSVGDFFYRSIVRRPLCREIFKNCNSTYNWVYNLPGGNQTAGKLRNDDLDFSIDRILQEISQVLNNTQMRDNPNSVMVLNLGLHYVQNINFTKYQELIERTIRLFRGEEGGQAGEAARRFKGHMIWKTTTAINRDRYGDPRTGAIHAKVIRFLTYQRVLLFNAYATSAMCDAGFDILDVFPMSNAHPNGTGLPNKPFDAVHFPLSTFSPAAEILEKYFRTTNAS